MNIDDLNQSNRIQLINTVSEVSENKLVGKKDKILYKIDNELLSRDCEEKSINQSSNHKESIDSNDDPNITKLPLWKACIMVGKMTLGISIMSLPKTFLSLSFTWGIIFMLLFAFFNWITFNLLANICNKYKTYDYAQLIKQILGEKIEYLYSFAIILSCGVTMIAYINIGNCFF